MSIFLKILIGLGLLMVAVLIGCVAAFAVIVISHEHRWRKCISDDYGIYGNEKEKR